MYHSISDAQIAQTLKDGDFPPEIRNAAEKVLVIMTQDWCEDWHAMETFVPGYEDQVTMFLLVYNLHPDFDAIREFKEDVFGNREIPYLRYYYRGQLIAKTNQLPRRTFEALLKRTEPFELS